MSQVLCYAISLYFIIKVISRPLEPASSSFMSVAAGFLVLSNTPFLEFPWQSPTILAFQFLDFPFKDRPCYHQLQPLFNPNVKTTSLTSPAILSLTHLFQSSIPTILAPPFLQPIDSTAFPSILEPSCPPHSPLFNYPTWISWYLSYIITPCIHSVFLGKSTLS